MRHLFLTAALLSLTLVLPAGAEGPQPLTAEEFDALTLGQIMDTWSGGSVYGVERFLPGRRSIWEDSRGCMYATWEQVGDQICFSYEDDPGNPDCWTYFKTDTGLSAQFRGDPAAQPIYLTPDGGPMTCNEYIGA
ncbi:hypothetical protein MASR1M32_36040 [Rhodobacter sp.]